MLSHLKKLALAAALLAGTAFGAHAAVLGAQGFADVGGPTADGSAIGDINTATSFSNGDLWTNGSHQGIFVGIPTQDFGAVSFSTTSGTSLSFGNSVFGWFKSTSITEASHGAGYVSFYVLGEWTPGTWRDVTGGPYEAEYTFSLTQTPPGEGGAISYSGTFSVAVPEPSTWAMLLAGFVGLGVVSSLASSKRAGAAA